MRESDKFKIDIYKLKNGEHEYLFTIDKPFFDELPIDDILKGKGVVNVKLRKSESLIEGEFKIELRVTLECDRSLEAFPFYINRQEQLIFKFGDEDAELDDNIVMIHRDKQRLDLAHYIYEFIHMSIPMKRLHPRFGEDTDEDELIYTSEKNDKVNEVDPRWEQLKSLKK